MMVNRAREMRDALDLYFVQNKIDPDDSLNENDWTVVNVMCQILRQLYLFTKEMSSEKHTSVSKIIPMISLMIDSYEQAPKRRENPIAKKLRNSILEGLKSRFKDVESTETYSNATIFDPRFKNLVFSSKPVADKAVIEAKAEAVRVANESQEIIDESDVETEPIKFENECDELWGSFSAKIKKNSKRAKITDDKQDGVDLEMLKYLSSPVIDRKQCPITWWFKIGQKQYPLLFEASKKYLCLIATSVPSERVFSKAGNILNKKRSLLGKETANKLVILHSNM